MRSPHAARRLAEVAQRSPLVSKQTMDPRRYESKFGRMMLTPLPEPVPPHRRTWQYRGSRISAPLEVRPSTSPLPARNPQAPSALSLIHEAVPNAVPDPFQRYR